MLIFCIVLLVTFACAQPTPPDAFPPSWYTWVVTTVVESGVSKPIYSLGQLVAFNLPQRWSCRLNQQDLVNPKADRPVDYCDFSAGKHYMLNSTVSNSTCSGDPTIVDNIERISYPPEYLSVAVYFGTDKVNQKDCYHFVASNIFIDNKNVQMDVWTATDNNFPCQISVTDLTVTPRIITTWAFDGFGLVIPTDAVNQCLASKILCAQADWLCHPTAAATDQELLASLNWVCNPAYLDCTPIYPGGPFYLPNTPRDHSKWAFNAYFIKNRTTQGPAACYFGGVAELVPPPTPEEMLTFTSSMSNSTQTFLQFAYDLTCERTVQ
jgi:hypothetical protein